MTIHAAGIVLAWASLLLFLAGAIVAFAWLTDEPNNEQDEQVEHGSDEFGSHR